MYGCGAGQGDRPVAVAGGDDLVAFMLQVVLERGDEGGLVIDDEDGLGGSSRVHELMIARRR